MATIIIKPDSTTDKDTWFSSSSPDTPHGGESTFNIGYRTATGGNFYTQIQFPLTAIPAGTVINSASLGIYAESTFDGETGNVLHKIFKITSTWTEAAVTWNTKPTYDATVQSSLTINAGATGYQIFTGLGALVQSWFSGGVTNYGLVIKHTTDDVKPAMTYTAAEGTVAQRPYLIIDYNDGGSFLYNFV